MPSLIKKLDSKIINQIAAGEVVEKPASILKELVENAIDAGASSISIEIENGGKTHLSISDNGSGMCKEDLHLAIQRHATSKLPENNLTDIHTFGFRGEALPSIASVSRMSIISKKEDCPAWQIDIHGGEIVNNQPAAKNENGTKIIVTDLFYATPARLKFLKNDIQENTACVQQFKKLALSYPQVHFSFKNEKKLKFDYKSAGTIEERIQQIVGEDFINNAMPISYESPFLKIEGLIGLPTFNSSHSYDQYIFVNKRPIKDRNIAMAARIAYGDTLPKGRFPIFCLYISIDVFEIDVNAHPAKTEIRFRNEFMMKQEIRKALNQALQKGASVTTSHNVVPFITRTNPSYYKPTQKPYVSKEPTFFPKTSTVKQQDFCQEIKEKPSIFGVPKAQIFENYIIAQNEEAVFIIDQHAVHERMTYEIYKKQVLEKRVVAQKLTIPEIIDFKDELLEPLKKHQEDIKKLGLEFEFFGKNQIAIRSVPSILKNLNLKELFDDLFHDLLESDLSNSFEKLFFEFLGNLACKHSIKSGRKLNTFEMEIFLKEMEKTKNVGQCNHGRPSYIKLSKVDIEKLFKRR